MNFIKLGNHVIAPAGTEPTAIVTSSDAAETLNLARLLESKVKELERTADERKTRRKEWKTRVDRLDRILVSLREQDAKEGEKLDKLFKRWNKTTLTSQRHTLDPVFSTRDPSRYDPAISAFNGNRECYRDTYTFSGSGWQATAGAGSHVSSPPSSPSAYTSDDRNRFCLTIPTEVSESRRDAEGFSGIPLSDVDFFANLKPTFSRKQALSSPVA
ncbi:hypothetical protein B0H10DRAFT_2220435 [Mycena sp. CBHHK59/15]|nr:hypothetical protein B0H10DRAFT_2220435 [Mycena sp. CBHHK59/15]